MQIPIRRAAAIALLTLLVTSCGDGSTGPATSSGASGNPSSTTSAPSSSGSTEPGSSTSPSAEASAHGSLPAALTPSPGEQVDYTALTEAATAASVGNDHYTVRRVWSRPGGRAHLRHTARVDRTDADREDMELRTEDLTDPSKNAHVLVIDQAQVFEEVTSPKKGYLAQRMSELGEDNTFLLRDIAFPVRSLVEKLWAGETLVYEGQKDLGGETVHRYVVKGGPAASVPDERHLRWIALDTQGRYRAWEIASTEDSVTEITYQPTASVIEAPPRSTWLTKADLGG